MKKIYYKDIVLSLRDYRIIDNKKKYIPLHVYIYKDDVVEMLDEMYKFYSKARHELHLLYKNDKESLIKDKDYISYGSKKIDISRLKFNLKNGYRINKIIEFDKKWDERPSRDNYTEILYYLSIDGYIPHIDKLEII